MPDVTRIGAGAAPELPEDEGPLEAQQAAAQQAGPSAPAAQRSLEGSGFDLAARAAALRGTGSLDGAQAASRAEGTSPRTAVEKAGASITAPGTPATYGPADERQAVALAKLDRIFGTGAAKELEPLFGAYAARQSAARGMAVVGQAGRPVVSEADFARTAGVSPLAAPPVGEALASLIRRSGAPADARVALRDAKGAALTPAPGDALRPVAQVGGDLRPVEAQVAGGRVGYADEAGRPVDPASVRYQLVDAQGAPRGGTALQVETKAAVLGLESALRFDFLDASGSPVPFEPHKGDRIALAFKKPNPGWVALLPEMGADGKVSGYEKVVMDTAGTAVKERARIGADDGAKLLAENAGRTMARVLGGDGRLRGDGDASRLFDAASLGLTRSTALLDQAGLARPEKPVRAPAGAADGDELAAAFKDKLGEHLLKPLRDALGAVTGFIHLLAGEPKETLDREAGEALARRRGATPMLVAEDGAVRPAELVTVSPEEVTALLAQTGPGAIASQTTLGARPRGLPESLTLTDGTTLDGVRVLAATRKDGTSVALQRETAGGFADEAKGLLRGEGMTREGGRATSTMASIQAGGADLASLTVRGADGATQSIPAEAIRAVTQDDAAGLSPADIWAASSLIDGARSFAAEVAGPAGPESYAVKRVATSRIKREELPAGAAAQAGLPGALAGTKDSAQRAFFRTDLTLLKDGEEQTRPLHYWASMGADGAVKDFAFVADPADREGTRAAAPPATLWQASLKDPLAARWGGESEAPGVSNAAIQGLYLGSTGALDHATVLGALTPSAMTEAKPRPSGKAE